MFPGADLPLSPPMIGSRMGRSTHRPSENQFQAWAEQSDKKMTHSILLELGGHELRASRGHVARE